MRDAERDHLELLHALRLMRQGSITAIADRLGDSPAPVEDRLLDAGRRAWVSRDQLAHTGTWSLTEAGKRHGERLLAQQLDAAGARPIATRVHTAFLELNQQVVAACTAYQLEELGMDGGTTAAETLAALHEPVVQWARLEQQLAAHVPRFEHYSTQLDRALLQALRDPKWITAMDRPSCHRTWFELHEDLRQSSLLARQQPHPGRQRLLSRTSQGW